MNNRLGLGLAVGAGYLLGRTKKLKFAFAVGTFVAGKKLQLSPKALMDFASSQLQNNPQFKELGDQLREDLRGVGTAATGAIINRQLGGLADRLHDRTLNVQDKVAGVVPDITSLKDEGKDQGRNQGKDQDEEYDEEPEEQPEEREQPRRQTRKKAESSGSRSSRGSSGSSRSSGSSGSGSGSSDSGSSRSATRTAKKTASSGTGTAKKTASGTVRKNAAGTAKKTAGTAKKTATRGGRSRG